MFANGIASREEPKVARTSKRAIGSMPFFLISPRFMLPNRLDNCEPSLFTKSDKCAKLTEYVPFEISSNIANCIAVLVT